MIKRNRVRIPDVIILLLSIVFTVGIVTVCGPCKASVHEDGVVTSCVYAGRILTALGLVLIIQSLLLLFVRDSFVSNGICVSIAPVALLVAAIPFLNIIPMCEDQAMHCNTVMAPFAMILGLIIGGFTLISSIIFFVQGYKDKKNIERGNVNRR